MRYKTPLAALLFCLPLFMTPALAQEQLNSFSAEMISTTPQGTMSMKLFTSGEKSRMEMAGQTVIVRRDLQVMWMVMPDQQMYMEQPIDPGMAAQSSATVDGEISREALGNEVIDGKNTKKFKVAYSSNGVSGEIYQWIDDKEFPVRTQAVDGSWTVDFKNVQTGGQPDSLFEPPAGYQKMAMPSMADLMRQAGQ